MVFYNLNILPLKYSCIDKLLALLLTFLIINMTTSCSYYTVRDITPTPENISNEIENFNSIEGYAVMHSGFRIWHLENLYLNENEQLITGIAREVSDEHIPLKPRSKKQVHRYNRYKQSPFNELHFNLKQVVAPRYGQDVIIPFSEITSLSVNDKNTGRSIANAVIGIVSVGAVVALVLYSIVALTCCSYSIPLGGY